jgi:ribosomal protein S18 acetylase RimI-like enzyme
MSGAVVYLFGKADEVRIAQHLKRCSADFVPSLALRVDIDAYARKLATRAVRFEAWVDEELVGLVAAYGDDATRRLAFITNVSVQREWKRRGIASRLLVACRDHFKMLGFTKIELRVGADSAGALRLYEKHGFLAGAVTDGQVLMCCEMEGTT